MVALKEPLSLGSITPWSTQGEYNVHLFAIQAQISKLQNWCEKPLPSIP
jgi:hypothetical protein